jgi:hypothetical protein
MVVDESQNGFIKGRFILDNILMVTELIRWTEDSGQECTILNTDLAKAYDKVEWPFIWAMLERIGLGPSIIRLIQSLHINASTMIIVNGIPSEPFEITRSVRQGCPLAPYLFVLCSEGLMALLDNAESSQLLKGVKLPPDSRPLDPQEMNHVHT